MARIQLFEGGAIGRDDPRVVPLRPADYGPSGLGEGLQKLGAAGSEAADTIDRINQAHDEAAAKEAMNAVSGHFTEIAYTGPNAYFDKQGKEALDLRPTVDSSVDHFIQNTRAGLQNERQQYLFDQAITPQRQQWGASVAAYALKETRTYAIGESKARAAMTGELARFSYFDNPEEGEKQLDTQSAEIAHQGELQGLGPDAIKAAQLGARSGAYKDIGYQLANQSGAQTQEMVTAFLDKHAGSMTGDDRTALSNYARVRQDAYEAEQRRIEAEQRRVAAQARSDARDRAETAIATIQDGLPLKPEDYASALDDARASGDDGLIRRLEQGQFKNNLTLQYQGSTPYQIEARVNELSADIKKAGDNADPKWLIERDHLETLLGKSREELKTNALGWGARNLGIEVRPVILSDPNSIRDRISAVAQISRATGMPAQPLQPDEVTIAQGAFNHGTTQEKANMVLHLAQFGPYAMDAAAQVTHNPAIINAVGLATHSNTAVAASRVNQIVTGYDVLKTKPKLVDKTQSLQQFDEYVGGALQFLPQVKAGVYSNAQALLATEANEAGVSEWGQLDSRAWFKAVNSALGAYTRDGHQVGGLARFNGGVTILPENMTQDEFESRISKSHGPEFRKAQNGVPVYGDGSHPTATQLKKMQWVPSGDGIYRLSDGNGFLHVSGGGFYEIDANKLAPSNFDAELAAHGYTRL